MQLINRHPPLTGGALAASGDGRSCPSAATGCSAQAKDDACLQHAQSLYYRNAAGCRDAKPLLAPLARAAFEWHCFPPSPPATSKP
eukprot:3007761-Amphidinium_carterae.1